MTWRPDYEIKSFYPDGQKHSRAMALHTWHVGDVSRDLEIDAYRSRMARGEIGRIEVKDCRTGQVQHIYPSPAPPAASVPLRVSAEPLSTALWLGVRSLSRTPMTDTMTNGKDWAEEEARKLLGIVSASVHLVRAAVDDIAAALRAAEARGIERAAEVLDDRYKAVWISETRVEPLTLLRAVETEIRALAALPADKKGELAERCEKASDAGYIQCPKCGALSGDDWSQCGGSCPMTASPYYNESAEHAFTAAEGGLMELIQKIARHYAEWANTPGNERTHVWWTAWENQRKVIMDELIDAGEINVEIITSDILPDKNRFVVP